MMTENTVIQVENVSKAFSLQPQQLTLRQDAGTFLKQWFTKKSTRRAPELHHALKNVSFSIRQGESVAIIGRNGSGKSTLLRIMSRIIRPTSGFVTVKGRYVALFGLSAGFIPTMTGRKNIYLNAAMYGVKPKEIEERIDDIIEFSEIGKYIDQPIRDYSKGMSARLGFSIAIHILPDMIFLDEVLAAGDAGFREKCGERIDQLKNDRKTIIFVSHSESSIRELCDRTLWLADGELIMDDVTDKVLDAYQSHFMRLKK
jgi:ABC-type polysaccharide/polyol phosphate transport system ATPase subunit